MLMLTCVCFQYGNNALGCLALSTSKINEDERVEFARWLVKKKRVKVDKPDRVCEHNICVYASCIITD